MTGGASPSVQRRSGLDWKNLVIDLLFLVVLAAGAYFRTVGTDWDQGQHLHPDERFLTLVEGSIRPVSSLADYFDTTRSSLNPHNVGHTFYVYGTLPLFLIRYTAEALGKISYGDIYLIGRQLSALADLLTVMLVYLIAGRLYGRRAALLAGAFSAFAVLQIQLSHYMTVDTFTNMFTFGAFYFAVKVAFPEGRSDSGALNVRTGQLYEINGPAVGSYILFGAMLGMAMASKVSAAPLALLLPAAAFIYYMRRTFENPRRAEISILFYLVLAAVTAFLVFRTGQPYAFSGPGFFDLKPNPLWIANLKELSAQALSDVPWALQWARRPLSFAWTNMVKWGLGLPLGILAWICFLWMARRIIKGEWQKHSLVWLWTLVYFAWQSTNFSRSMRYQLLVYPTLSIIAGWGIVRLWDKGKALAGESKKGRWLQALAAVVGVISVAGTLAWAFAFTRIYTVPVTRVQATEWINANIPGPLNFVLDTVDGENIVPLPYRAGTSFTASQPYVITFKPSAEGVLTGLSISNLWDAYSEPRLKNLHFEITLAAHPDQVLGSAEVSDPFVYITGGKTYTAQYLDTVILHPSQEYLLRITVDDPATSMVFNGMLSLALLDDYGIEVHQDLAPPVQRISPGMPYTAQYSVQTGGTLKAIQVPHLVDQTATPGGKTLRLTIMSLSSTSPWVTWSDISYEFTEPSDARGDAYTFELNQPVTITAGEQYLLTIEMTAGTGEVSVYGSWPALETVYDDAVPLYGSIYSPYGDSSYVYRGDLKFESYWPDNEDKKERIQSTLDQADYIFITSNRQWGTTTRVPERYPLTTLFYRELIGCPAEKDILWCYSTAEPGKFAGRLGFKLVQVFQSDPHIGSLRINDQLAEEAFTVYDHPKVLIFQKDSGYDSTAVAQTLDTADLSLVMNLLPYQFTYKSENITLPPVSWSIQQLGGTWSELFNTDAWFNRWPGLGAALWYLAAALLGWMMYPLVRLALPGLRDRGYPLVRTAGLVVLAYAVWLGGSLGWQVNRAMITQVVLLLALAAAGLAYLQRQELGDELRRRWKYMLLVEGLALVFFAIDLAIRIGNPDLWHPAYGGEKPMDFSYFNAVLKSSTFPPYDPWFAGGYINYYYYGYVIAAVLAKWLGIVPSVAYNLILPTMFSLLALGAFSVVWNLAAHARKKDPLAEDFEHANPTEGVGQGPDLPKADQEDMEEEEEPPVRPVSFRRILSSPVFWIGIAGAAGVVLLGNLGTVRMIWVGLQRLAAPGGTIDGASILRQIAWAAGGLVRYIGGADLPYSLGDWYWKPSRAIQPEAGSEITEFPFFTFLYGDMHAHLIALPLTVLLIACLVSLVFAGGRWKASPAGLRRWIGPAAGVLLTSLTLGALRPTNTWDFYTYLLLTGAAALYACLANRERILPGMDWLSEGNKRLLKGGLLAAIMVGLAVLFYQPFSDWYHQAYNTIIPWKGAHTQLGSYLVHWGLFLFLIASWMTAETHQWLVTTPMRALLKLKPFWLYIQIGLAGFLLIAAGLLYTGIQIGWLVILMGLWAVLLILRPGQSSAKRIVLFLTGSGLALTLFVELFVLQGDIGRMNTVFKFYLQAWIFFAIGAAAGLYWFLEEIRSWRPKSLPVWAAAAVLLVMGAALFPMYGGLAKIRDRMAPSAPHGLDGMAYMKEATYTETWGKMDLAQDYQAIRWLQENVPGSTVIVEANNRNLYRWGSRMTIYTGLPGVVGWEWHQQQQKAVLPGSVITNRILEIEAFYRTTDPEQARAFLAKYNVGYIILGQQERGMYAGAGLTKFDKYEGILWQEVYRDGDTVIYQTVCKCGTG